MRSFAIAIAIALVGCSKEYLPEPPTETYFPTAAGSAVAYGGNTLPAEKAAIFPTLAFPQARPDMISTFGYPSYVTPISDIYTVADGRKIEVFYEGETATRYQER